MKFLSASVLSIFAATASAADCFGQPQSNLGKTYGDAYWDARAQMCSNTNCEYQKDCTTYAKKTVQGWRIKLTANVSLKRQKLNGNGFKDCWAATEQIINQCVYGNGQMGGTWVYGGQVYTLSSTWSN